MVSNSSGLSSVKLMCPAKINLYLAVGKRRSDGFHEINTVFQTINLYDELFIKHDTSKFYFKCNTSLRWDQENTLRKVISQIESEIGRRIEVGLELRKRIPSGAGLGGGSSNAAALLKYFAEVFKIAGKRVSRIASDVGSDVTFFLRGGTAIATGRGEILSFPGDVSGYSVELALPVIGVSTPLAYGFIDEDNPDLHLDFEIPQKYYLALKCHDTEAVKRMSYNTFEKSVFDRFPEIRDCHSMLVNKNRGAIKTMMTGSGSAIFSLFEGYKGRYSFVSSEELNEKWCSMD
ncbi:MAG: 4-(cytidine 5'-diphospho)-2-C-methyl-D-erythritol kinase [Kosmotogaceae bacterium]|nr:4-(cytidine 5'-diphospho)-2-C-methyl-D-erythritol kinase [Kosmotogaceae bacterium]